jgi:predicted Zn-dependent peptidase
MTGVSCEPEEAAGNLHLIREMLEDARLNGVTEEELAQAKNKICAQMVLSAERPSSRMFSVGNGWVQRRQYKTIREAVESYRKVTLADIATVLKKYPLTMNTTVAVGPLMELKME